MVRMVGGRRWGVIWNDRTGRRLVVERIVLFVVSHGFKGGTGSAQQREVVVVGSALLNGGK